MSFKMNIYALYVEIISDEKLENGLAISVL